MKLTCTLALTSEALMAGVAGGAGGADDSARDTRVPVDREFGAAAGEAAQQTRRGASRAAVSRHRVRACKNGGAVG
eukprot:4465639-Pleurochrysis_carterae.AAC.4